MRIEHLRVNHMEKPLGYHFPYLTFSWKVTESKAQFSSRVRLRIALQENMEAPIFDSGIREEFRFCRMDVEMELRPRTRYYWKVNVSTDQGEEAESDVSWFETGKMAEKWSADWITTEKESKRMPLLYKSFSVSEPIKRSRLYIFGAGLYEAYLNGKKISEEYLLPGYHSYDCFMEYQTFDMTELVWAGENQFSVLLGEGWYKGRFGFDDHDDTYHDLYGERKKCIAELHIEYENGKEQVIVTDDTWEAYESAVLENGIYDGETVDDTLQAAKLNVETLSDTKELLTERTSMPIHKTEKFSPIAMTWQQDFLLIDFGESITGWVELCGKPEAGQRIQIQYGEVLQDNTFYRDNLRTAKAEFVYISDGTQKVIRPHFTYYGFRYLKVEGLKREQAISFQAYRLMSDLEETGYIETSNEKVNTLFQNTKRSQKCNFLDIPTDCPQRDERMGWTGDVAIFANTACFHMDCGGFFPHYTRTLYEEQKLLQGAVPFFAPRPKVKITEKTNPFYLDGGACLWSDVATLLPWTLFTYYGDKGMLRQHYPMMKLWVDYVRQRSDQNEIPYLWQNDRHLGDWLALDNGNLHNPIGKTDMGLLASLFYFWSASILAKAGKVLAYEEYQEYEVLAAKIKEAFVEYYFTKDGKLTVEETQTACALLLYTKLYPTNAEAYLKEALQRLIREAGGHLNTGFAGTPFLCPALSENGMNEIAYDLLLTEDYPGWLHQVNLGATTVWERWNSLDENGRISGTGMNSLNHYAYGSIAEWMYRYMCGFQPQWDQELSMVIAPMPDQRFAYVNGKWESPNGTYICQWQYGEDGTVSYDIEIPFNEKAEMIFPNGSKRLLAAGKYHFHENGESI